MLISLEAFIEFTGNKFVLPSWVEFCQVLWSFIEFLVLLGFIGFDSILSIFSGFSPKFTEFCRVLPCLISIKFFYWVLLGVTSFVEFYRVLTSLT